MADNKYDKVFKKLLDNKELSDEMDKISPGIKDQIVGYLMSSWLPRDATRKIIMAIITPAAFIGGFIYSRNLFYLLLLILPFFSPRIVGEVVMFLGRISRSK